MSDLRKAQMLLRLARENGKGGQVSGLGLEILLSVAQRPQRLEELEHSCAASNAAISRATRQMAVRWDRKAGAVIKPDLPLLIRRPIPRQKGQVGGLSHRYHLTNTAREFLAAAGFSTPVN